MTDKPDDNLSADEAVKRSWAKLRRAVMHREQNEGAERWRRIDDRNNFGAAIRAAMQQREARP